MKESYRKGLASHPDPESCEGSRKTALEALTGAQIGPVIELRNQAVEGADAVKHAEGNMAGGASASPQAGPSRSAVQLWRTGVEEPGHVWKLHVREPGDPVAARGSSGCGPVGEGDEL
jgi:hypothetical protein